MEEQVALYDESGRPCGVAPRSRVRAENLRHGATGIVVRDSLGRFYVHRRTDTKDVYPGRYDLCAGGVLQAGEEPLPSALRELAEELGVTGVPLESLGEGDYADAHTSYHAFLYTTTYDGPITWQPEEVAWGDWVTRDRLVAMLDEVSFVPDTVALLHDWLSSLATTVTAYDGGWDSAASLVEGRWVDRVPRRPEVAPRLLAETRLMPALARRLPVAVPVPAVLDESPLRVRHVIVPGSPVNASHLDVSAGVILGRLLRVLHDTDVSLAVEAGVTNADESRRWLLAMLERFAADVLPRLPSELRGAGRGLLDEAASSVPARLVHGDLGPDHLLADGGRLSGVIDWTDARVDDPAVDLAWAVHGTPRAFADALVAEYGASPDELRRALTWHRLGPWHEVIYGLDNEQPSYVESGLAGVASRLSW